MKSCKWCGCARPGGDPSSAAGNWCTKSRRMTRIGTVSVSVSRQWGSAASQFIIDKYLNNDRYRFYLNADGDLQIYLRNTEGNIFSKIHASQDLRDDSWYHVAFVADRDNNGTLYLDGNAVGEWDLSALDGYNISSPNRNLAIGRVSGSASGHFSGSIDDAMIFRRALSAAEIQAIYDAQKNFCTGISTCSEYPDSGSCTSDSCNTGLSCEWEGNNCALTGNVWYVRPDEGAYGTEDGSSYANAWDGFSNINWTTLADDNDNTQLFVAGTHYELLTIGQSGESGQPITIISYPSDPGIIDGGLTRYECIHSDYKSYITIDGLTVQNAIAGAAKGTIFFARGNNVIIQNCTVYIPANKGIDFWQMDDSQILNNYIDTLTGTSGAELDCIHIHDVH